MAATNKRQIVLSNGVSGADNDPSEIGLAWLIRAAGPSPAGRLLSCLELHAKELRFRGADDLEGGIRQALSAMLLKKNRIRLGLEGVRQLLGRLQQATGGLSQELGTNAASDFFRDVMPHDFKVVA
jgi:hypothetical protein